jgi:hypothetical protein
MVLGWVDPSAIFRTFGRGRGVVYSTVTGVSCVVSSVDLEAAPTEFAVVTGLIYRARFLSAFHPNHLS